MGTGSLLSRIGLLLTFLSPGTFGITAEQVVTAELVPLGRSSTEALGSLVWQHFAVLGILEVPVGTAPFWSHLCLVWAFLSPGEFGNIGAGIVSFRRHGA